MSTQVTVVAATHAERREPHYGMGDVFRFNGCLWMFTATDDRMGLTNLRNGWPMNGNVSWPMGFSSVTLADLEAAYRLKLVPVPKIVIQEC